MYRIKLQIDRILSNGYGSQLLWLFIIFGLCLTAALAVSPMMSEEPLPWQYTLSLFIDPGRFMTDWEKVNVWFRLAITFIGIFLFTALLVSVFTNVFENITDGVLRGRRRYSISGHALVLGGGSQLQHIVKALNDAGKRVVVMSPNDININGDYIYYNGRRDLEADLVSARPDKAESIYIIGENEEPAHDAISLSCLQLLRNICINSDHKIHCYLSVEEQSTSEIFYYTRNQTSPLQQIPNLQKDGSLLVDVVNHYEYMSEQLMVDTDFLPVLRKGDRRTPHIVILGDKRLTQATAYTAAHICHYPGYAEQGIRTVITIIEEDIKRTFDELKASRPDLFRLSHYTYISHDGKTTKHKPEGKDFLDIEWRFVEGYAESELARNIISNTLGDDCATSIIVCNEQSSLATNIALHLPHLAFEKANIAIYMSEDANVIEKACATGMYGNIKVFGPASGAGSDPLFVNRNKHGQKVNFIYDQAYGNPPSSSPEEAWYKISEADKFSSIYCANAFPLRLKCFDMKGAKQPLCEAEHRRWMMSSLIMGYAPGKNTDKKKFIHSCILPFKELSKGEQKKDSLLIDGMMKG